MQLEAKKSKEWPGKYEENRKIWHLRSKEKKLFKEGKGV